MLNHAGCITEASNSNVFFVLDGKLVTPAESSGNLRGLTKAAVRIACKANGLTTFEKELTLTVGDKRVELTECFVTSATREVMPVRSLRLADGTELEFPAGGGALTQRAQTYYKDYVDAYVNANAHYSMY